jgi:hypothetical protein
VPAAFSRLHPVEINFNDQWQLAGLRFDLREGRVSLALRWRCLRAVPYWLRCFAHVVDAGGETMAWMDHDVLGACPPAAEWRPGDEGYEERYTLFPRRPASRSLLLGPQGYEVEEAAEAWPVLRLRLGLYDTGSNMRLPVRWSSLPVTEQCTAAVVEPNTAPGQEVVFRLDPAPWRPCRLVFKGGPELTGYAVTRRGNAVWLRLRWVAPEQHVPALRFFGHGVKQADPEVESLASFDQELLLDRYWGRGEFEQDIVRMLERPAEYLRGGVCTSPGLERLALRSSTLPTDEQARCFFVPLN